MRASAITRLRPASALAAATPIAVRSCGALAHRALLACNGVTRPLKGFEATSFRLAGNELVWIGVNAPLHPRAALVDATVIESAEMCLDVKSAQVHAAKTVGGQQLPSVDALQTLTRATLRLVQFEKPAGFGQLLAAQALPFPLSHRRDAAVTLAQACGDDNADAFSASAIRLLGVGSGLTPSGDDFVGGALFAQRAFGVTGGTAATAWNDARDSIVSAAPTRTHVISSTLLHDLARGESYAALHALASALTHDDENALLDAMRAVVTIGHSSGWDMLAGFFAAVSGTTHLTCTTPLT